MVPVLRSPTYWAKVDCETHERVRSRTGVIASKSDHEPCGAVRLRSRFATDYLRLRPALDLRLRQDRVRLDGHVERRIRQIERYGMIDGIREADGPAGTAKDPTLVAGDESGNLRPVGLRNATLADTAARRDSMSSEGQRIEPVLTRPVTRRDLPLQDLPLDLLDREPRHRGELESSEMGHSSSLPVLTNPQKNNYPDD